MVPGLSDQWLAVIMVATAGLVLFSYGVISAKRFDARVRRDREKAEASRGPQ
jgi:hypothetical protein